jgi:hypothetical protein
MSTVRVDRFGWSDEAGPLWFLHDRWSCGPRWRQCWAMFWACEKGVTMHAHTKKGGYAFDGFFIDAATWQDMSYFQKESVIVSWLKSVRRPGPEAGPAVAASDPSWVHDLPAVHEFLVTEANPDGSVRRTSTLTIFAEGGSWKVFLNERDTGASLCASGATVSDALSALEVMLEQEVVPWRFSQRVEQKGNGRARKGS